MSEGLDQAIELVLSVLGGELLIPDDAGPTASRANQAHGPDEGVDVVTVLPSAGRRGKRGGKRDPAPGQAGLF